MSAVDIATVYKKICRSLQPSGVYLSRGVIKISKISSKRFKDVVRRRSRDIIGVYNHRTSLKDLLEDFEASRITIKTLG